MISSDQVGLDVDVAVRCLGIRADLVCRVDQRLRDLAVDPRQAHVEPRAEEVGAAVEYEIDLSVNGR